MNPPLNLVFAGTPAFAVPTLEGLVQAGFLVRLVITQPDRPRGRGMELAYSPVKQKSLQLGLPTIQPGRIKDNQELRGELSAINPDAIIVVGYGRIIPQWMIELPRLGNINLHASLLPRYRGAAPIQWAIANGDAITGVTTMRIDAGLDTGDILLQKELAIMPDETAEMLGPRLATIGATLMIDTLKGLNEWATQPRAQDHSRATQAPTLTREDGRIDFHRSGTEIWNRLRGFQPWPGAFTKFRDKNLHVWEARPVHDRASAGELVIQNDRLIVGCGANSALELRVVQPEGKKRMSALDFIHGYRPRPGEMLG